jgi:hypothetical protein
MRKLVVLVAVLVAAVAVVFFVVSGLGGGRVPGGVRVVDVTLRIGHGLLGNENVVARTHVFTGAATVQALITSVDALATVPKGSIWNCPAAIAEPTRRQLVLSFKPGAARRAIARVEVDVSQGSEGDSGWTVCDGIEFSVGGKRQIVLVSHTFVRHIGKLIGSGIS